MKKIFLSIAVIASMTLVSCQPSATKAEDEGAEIKAKIENCQNPDSLKIYVEQARAYAEKLQNEGDATAAQAYLDEVTPAVAAKDPTMVSIFDILKNKADSTLNAAKDKVTEEAQNAVENGKEAVNDAKDKVVNDAANAVENGKQTVNNAVNNVNEKGKQVVNDVNEKGKQAVDNAKQNASDAIQKGADKLKGALK